MAADRVPLSFHIIDPQDIEARTVASDGAVVVDLFRATATLQVLVDMGCERATPRWRLDHELDQASDRGPAAAALELAFEASEPFAKLLPEIA